MPDGVTSLLRNDVSTPLLENPGRSVGEVERLSVGSRHFLFVSAPFGPFARQLAQALKNSGCACTRVILNGGDLLDWGFAETAFYFGGSQAWRRWLQATVRDRGVTDIVTYGDSNPYLVDALLLARDLGIRTHVFEQGYFRPNWITLERNGVNANSGLPRDPDWYRQQSRLRPDDDFTVVGRTMPSAVGRIVRYHVAAYLGVPAFLRYKAPYRYPAIAQAFGHAVRFVKKELSTPKHRRVLERLMGSGQPLYLVLLQRPGDSQLWRHSDFERTEAFLDKVVTSFAAHAPADAHLIIRPHPLDHGLDPHEVVLTHVAAREGVKDRIHFVDYGKLHEVLPAMSGAVCVNSTAGLAAVEFGCPTAVLGRAMYDMRGMTHQGSLDSFWRTTERPDEDLYWAFRKVIMGLTQINGAYATSKGRRLAVREAARRLLNCEADYAAA